MKLELTAEQGTALKPLLARCRDNGELSPSVAAGQIMPGDWQTGPEKLFLHVCAIKPATARKIRKLIENERPSATADVKRSRRVSALRPENIERMDFAR